jgi:hypothetical protein
MFGFEHGFRSLKKRENTMIGITFRSKPGTWGTLQFPIHIKPDKFTIGRWLPISSEHKCGVHDDSSSGGVLVKQQTKKLHLSHFLVRYVADP